MAVLFLIFCCFVFDFFGSDLSKMDQTWSNLIKLDQTWSNWISHQSKNVTIKSCHIYRKDRNKCDNFLARNGFLAVMAWIMASLQKLLFVQKYFCQIWSGFLARNGFFQMNLPYFSKYWKFWLAFDGWKLSGLFSLHLPLCYWIIF